MRWDGLWVAGLVALCLGLPPASAQSASDAPVAGTPVITIDQERLFAESQFGKASLARLAADEQALVAENLKIEGALETEERALTEQRQTLPAPDFRSLADAFDVKVEGVRSAQRAKYTALTAAHEADQRRFLQVAVPVIGQLMQDMGAVVVMDKQTIFLSLQRIDMTDVAITRVDAAIGDGSTLPPEDAPVDPGGDAPAPGDPAPLPVPAQP
jgi:Skp family chaperone for outer membrane proteins